MLINVPGIQSFITFSDHYTLRMYTGLQHSYILIIITFYLFTAPSDLRLLSDVIFPS